MARRNTRIPEKCKSCCTAPWAGRAARQTATLAGPMARSKSSPPSSRRDGAQAPAGSGHASGSHRPKASNRPASAPVIEFRGVTKRYPSGDMGLDRATFNVGRGEFVFLVGSTGSGKSTVMRLLLKEIDPTEG